MDMEDENLIKPLPLLDADSLAELPVRLIAFYLPQFHPIPENDKWWGKGFTEWTNVKSVTPQFVGHYQPRVPGELGYYDLRSKEVQRRQVELAKLYGISGFCFYLYWFGGKRLLELPVQNYLENQELDLPFCVCWANENWSRRWDGLNNKILMEQNHSPEDDLAFIEHVSIYLKDSRYIRIKGKPLLIVYQPALFPSIRKTVKRWRNWCRENDIGEIYLAYTQSFEAVNPKKYDFDGAIEFPPNNSVPPVITGRIKPLSPEFSGIVYDWNIFVERSRKYKKPDYPLFRGVCPSWDNTARRKGKAGIFYGSTPDKYRKWVENAAMDTIERYADPSERIVFVNAWNEWAEGAYLEPDQKYGYAYLQATRDALERINAKIAKRHIVLVAHDAYPHGAQYLILHMAKALVEDFGFAVDMVVLGDGPLLEDYERYATLYMLSGKDARGEKAKTLAMKLFTEGVRSAIANTAVTGLFAKILKEQGFNVVSLIHELPGIIKEHKLQPHIKSIAKHADWVVFPANQVKEGFNRFFQISSQRTIICPQGLFRKNSIRSSGQLETARHNLRKKFNLPETAQIVLCVGYADHRKGIDLFVDIGLKVMQQNTNAYFLWVGHFDSNIESKIKKMINNSGFSGHFVFPGIDFQSDLYYAGSDIFALTSREDPFPSVVAEALDASLPVVAFDGAGGFTELLSRGGGLLVPAFDTSAFADALIDLMRSPDNAHRLAQSGKTIVENELSFRRYVFDLLALAKAPLKRVSVIVPNFNYAEYLVERITSIVNQDYPIYEIIILDDASSDDSVKVLNNLIPTLHIDCKFIINDSNSGSPFVQWLKGVELARGDYIWIAEADDLSEPGFLKEVLVPFKDPSIVMSYCQSKQMDSKGKILFDNYLDYVSDISSDKWLTHYIEEGLTEVRSSLAIKNVIPNVSAVVFERKAFLHALKNGIEEIKKYHVAGDWQTYLSILKNGKIAFSPEPLNLHRRHQHSVTIGNFNLSQLEEILAVQQKVRNNFRPSEEVISKAKAYSQRLYEDFDLVTRDAPILAKHPSLAVYLENCK
jgi:glycosyltransferase involved in cell wall biosynthesis